MAEEVQQVRVRRLYFAADMPPGWDALESNGVCLAQKFAGGLVGQEIRVATQALTPEEILMLFQVLRSRGLVELEIDGEEDDGTPTGKKEWVPMPEVNLRLAAPPEDRQRIVVPGAGQRM